jgi:ABC-type sugar transport system ATPase subunit
LVSQDGRILNRYTTRAHSEQQPNLVLDAVEQTYHLLLEEGNVKATDVEGVDLVLPHNEVLGLVGDNAAGKSTLMKVLSGAYIPDDGEILLEGNAVDIVKPEDSRRLGIEMVYQDFALANNMDYE